jgi:hypothetical protein
MGLSEEAYKQLWNSYCELGEMQRHFGNAQSRYRALASTWMLAAMVGIGFVVEKKLEIIPTELLVGLIGVVASVGLGLLWVIDLLVYQRLLDAAYIEGRSLETAQPWLPQVRNNMRRLLGGEGLRLITLFYMVSIVFMGAVGGIGFGLWLFEKSVSNNVLILGGICYSIFLLLVAWGIGWRTSTTKKLEEQERGEEGLEAQRTRSYKAYKDFNVSYSYDRSNAASPNKANATDS